MPKIVGFIIILIALGLFTVSFGTYWYKYEAKSYADDDESRDITYYNYNKRRVVEYNYEGEKIYDETSEYSRDGREHEIQIFEASLAFSVLAWVTLAINLFLYILSFVGIIDKVPVIGQIGAVIGKYILILGSIFGLLSLFIFIGMGSAKDKDCNCSGNKFLERQTSEYYERDYYLGPFVGWFVVVIGCAFTIVGAIINIVTKTFNL